MISREWVSSATSFSFSVTDLSSLFQRYGEGS